MRRAARYKRQPLRWDDGDYEVLVQPVPYARGNGRFLTMLERGYLRKWSVRTNDITRVQRFDMADDTWGVCELPDGSWVVLRQMARHEVTQSEREELPDRSNGEYSVVIDPW